MTIRKIKTNNRSNVICPRCEKVLKHNSHNFGPLPGNSEKLDTVCILCRYEINSEKQKRFHQEAHDSRKEFMEAFHKRFNMRI